MKILLVRHGESEANVDINVYKAIPDHAVPLSELGREQALNTGQLIKNYYEELYGDALKAKPMDNDISKMFSMPGENGKNAILDHFAKALGGIANPKPKIRLWQSPYKRARETAAIIEDQLGDIIIDRREHVLLCEQNFGLFDGLEEDEQKEKFPDEYACFEHTQQANGKFWARHPMGESAFDTACRIHQAFGTFHRDAEEHGIDNIIVVCHGTVLRLFVMMWRHLPPEWFAKEHNPGNACIRILDGSEDKGYLHGGERKGKPWEYEGNEQE